MTNVREHIRQAIIQPPRTIELESFRLAAVAIIVTHKDELLLMRRAEHAKDPWSGHLSFPGGRQDPTDKSDLDVAIRETKEEIGFDLAQAEHLGRLDDIRTLQPLPPILIRPHLFFCTEPIQPVLNDEAVALHTLSIEALLNGTGRGVMNHPWRGTDRQFPCIRFDNVCLWGLTLHMVDDLLHRIDGKGRGLERLETYKPTPHRFEVPGEESWQR